jgi:NADPH-dependent F420 reductase
MLRTIAILGGTGEEGSGLALRFAHAGLNVRIGSRDPQKAQAAAARLAQTGPRGSVEGFSNAEACQGAEIIVLTVPLSGQIATLQSVRGHLQPGQIVVDATVPLEAAIGGRLSRTLTLWAGSAAEQAAQYLPEGVAMAAAFHSLSARALSNLNQPLDCDVLICGSNSEARAAVAELTAAIPGARAVDTGPLENARLAENVAALLVSLNLRHKVRHSGLRITGLADER